MFQSSFPNFLRRIIIVLNWFTLLHYAELVFFQRLNMKVYNQTLPFTSKNILGMLTVCVFDMRNILRVKSPISYKGCSG